jgi:lipoprotein-anchoring transpeptidase ErfK/SrfK
MVRKRTTTAALVTGLAMMGTTLFLAPPATAQTRTAVTPAARTATAATPAAAALAATPATRVATAPTAAKKAKRVVVDKRCRTGRVVCVSKKTRKVYWVVNGKIKLTLDARFGGKRTPTRNGKFKVYRKSRNHVSSLYHTPMPFSLFFSGGQAVHYSPDFARRGYSRTSHGCVNTRQYSKMRTLFNAVRVGDRVVVYK